jgi:hypothetical protein
VRRPRKSDISINGPLSLSDTQSQREEEIYDKQDMKADVQNVRAWIITA